MLGTGGGMASKSVVCLRLGNSTRGRGTIVVRPSKRAAIAPRCGGENSRTAHCISHKTNGHMEISPEWRTTVCELETSPGIRGSEPLRPRVAAAGNPPPHGARILNSKTTIGSGRSAPQSSPYGNRLAGMFNQNEGKWRESGKYAGFPPLFPSPLLRGNPKSLAFASGECPPRTHRPTGKVGKCELESGGSVITVSRHQGSAFRSVSCELAVG